MNGMATSMIYKCILLQVSKIIKNGRYATKNMFYHTHNNKLKPS